MSNRDLDLNPFLAVNEIDLPRNRESYQITRHTKGFKIKYINKNKEIKYLMAITNRFDNKNKCKHVWVRSFNDGEKHIESLLRNLERIDKNTTKLILKEEERFNSPRLVK